MENINTSFPNDGLGDKVRTAFIKVNNNFTELNNGKVDKILGYGLSENNYSDADADLVANAVQPTDLAEVATTGDYFDLLNQPTSFPPSAHTHVYTDLDLTVENEFEKAELKLWKDSLSAFAELKNTDLVNGYIGKARIGKNRLLIDSDNPTFKGIVGNVFYDKQLDPLAFTQMKDLTDKYIPYTGTDDKLITGNFQVASQQKTFFENSQYEFKYEIDDTNNWVMILAIDKISGYKSQTTYEIGSLQTVLTTVDGSVSFNTSADIGFSSDKFFDKNNDDKVFAQIGDIGTGYGVYTGKDLSISSPLIIAEGDTELLTNDGDETNEIHLPVGVTTFYDPLTSKIMPDLNGDSYLINVRLTASSDDSNGLFEIGIDIGGGITIGEETKSLRKGIGATQKINMIFDAYAGATFIANGGVIKIKSIRGNTTVYEVTYKITRTHKAKIII